MFVKLQNKFSADINGFKAGFTLIELIVVIAILGILAVRVIWLINPLTQFQRGADTQRKNDLGRIQKALETYYNDHGYYPISDPGGTYQIYDSGGAHVWGFGWSPYLDTLPQDPVSTKKYIYVGLVSSGGACPAAGCPSYRLYASLDRANNDAQACNPDGVPTTDDKCGGVPGGVLCGSSASQVCDYGVSSQDISP